METRSLGCHHVYLKNLSVKSTALLKPTLSLFANGGGE
ncbi:hypothetical protein AC062_0997 [Pasteurellaceae bacterium NI1060]|nr:hypothetical protein AC062_0997 [Pasteurellaceae bacterium NI1060]